MKEELRTTEVFDIAQQVNEDAIEFYQESIPLFTHHQNTFLDLVQMEKQMGLRLEKIKHEVLQRERNTNSTDDSLFKSIAGVQIFETMNPAKIFVERMRKSDIIKVAIKIELEIVKYFEGLKRFTSEHVAENVIDFLINERHKKVDLLKEMLL